MPETAPPQGRGELVSTVTAPGGGGGMGGAVSSAEEGVGSTGDVGSGAAFPNSMNLTHTRTASEFFYI